MPENISLRCLLKGSNTYCIIKELKSNSGELDFGELKRKLKLTEMGLSYAITDLYPAVIQNNSKVSVSESYDFIVVSGRGAVSFYQARCRKHNYSGLNTKWIPPEAEDLGFHEYLDVEKI